MIKRLLSFTVQLHESQTLVSRGGLRGNVSIYAAGRTALRGATVAKVILTADWIIEARDSTPAAKRRSNILIYSKFDVVVQKRAAKGFPTRRSACWTNKSVQPFKNIAKYPKPI
jgi:accessory colonization factor AcfC